MHFFLEFICYRDLVINVMHLRAFIRNALKCVCVYAYIILHNMHFFLEVVCYRDLVINVIYTDRHWTKQRVN